MNVAAAKIRTLTVLALATSVISAYARPSAAQDSSKIDNIAPVAIVEIWDIPTGRQTPVGSGVAISLDGNILTAKHLVMNFDPARQAIYLRFRSRNGIPIKVVGPPLCPDGDPDNGGADICVLRVSDDDLRAAGVSTVPRISCRTLARNEEVFGRGWPGDPAYGWDKADGKVTSERSALSQYPTDASGLHGMSGGPFYDKTGVVVGLIKGGLGDTEKRTLLSPLFGARALIEATGSECSASFPDRLRSVDPSKPNDNEPAKPSEVATTTTFRDCAECPEMALLPGGRFLMGSPPGEVQRQNNEGPQQSIKVAPFAVGRFKVTFSEWDACVGAGGCDGYQPGDEGWGRDDRPVINVAWADAQAYVDWLSRRTGHRYRLPSEAEWEYAARAGTTTPFSTGRNISPDQAQYDWTESYAGSSTRPRPDRTSSASSFLPNLFGLYQVHGNLGEWARDCYTDGLSGHRADGAPVELPGCSVRVLRGGSWEEPPANIRSAVRTGLTSGHRSDYVGFRVAREP